MQSVAVSHDLYSHFSISLFLPADNRDPSHQNLRPAEHSRADDVRRTRVLVVDDSPDVSEMLGMLLSLSGYGVTLAASAAEALDQARAHYFDVVVSDIGMPEMDGYELARALRALPGYDAVPMIAVTGFARYDDRQRALRSGFDAHLTKPLDPSTLLDLIESLMRDD